MAIPQGPLSGLTLQPFERFLERLGPDREATALEYGTVRGRLIELFDWWGVASPEVLADETIGRFARRLDEGVTVELPPQAPKRPRQPWHSTPERASAPRQGTEIALVGSYRVVAGRQ
jgi:hypothetical protein